MGDHPARRFVFQPEPHEFGPDRSSIRARVRIMFLVYQDEEHNADHDHTLFEQSPGPFLVNVDTGTGELAEHGRTRRGVCHRVGTARGGRISDFLGHEKESERAR